MCDWWIDYTDGWQERVEGWAIGRAIGRRVVDQADGRMFDRAIEVLINRRGGAVRVVCRQSVVRNR